MDFVQRNLINERNNLQIELAKAKLLIAELSEEKEIVGKKPEQAPYGENPKADPGNNGKYEPRRVSPVRPSFPTKNGDTTSKPTNEQAEYISDLENVIISIAEQLGVHPNDLLNEIHIHINKRDTSTSGPYTAAAKEKSRGISDALLNDPSQNGVDARAEHRRKEQGRIDARAQEYKDQQRRMAGYPKPTGLG